MAEEALADWAHHVGRAVPGNLPGDSSSQVIQTGVTYAHPEQGTQDSHKAPQSLDKITTDSSQLGLLSPTAHLKRDTDDVRPHTGTARAHHRHSKRFLLFPCRIGAAPPQSCVSEQQTVRALLQHPTVTAAPARQNWPGLLGAGKHARLLRKLRHDSARCVFEGCERTRGGAAVTHAAGGCIKCRAIIPLIPGAPSGLHHICHHPA